MITIFSKLTGFALNVATLATLAAWEAGHLEDGARAWTADLHDAWVLSKSAIAGTAADGITVVAASGAGPSAFWIRQVQGDLYWAFQGNWAVDPVNGVDTAKGDSPANALKTVAELGRRLAQVRQNTTYNVDVYNDVPNTDSFVDMRRIVSGATTSTNHGSTIVFTGQRTVTGTYTAAAGTKNTAPNTAAASAQAEAVRAAGNWAGTDIGKLIVDSQGNTSWVLSAKDLGATARVTDWISSTAAWVASPPTEGAASLTSLTKWRAPVTAGGSAGPNTDGVSAWVGDSIAFVNFEFDQTNTGSFSGLFNNTGASFEFWVCKFSDGAGGSSGIRPFVRGSVGLVTFYGCMIHHGTLLANIVVYEPSANAPGLHITYSGGNGAFRVRFNLGSSPTIVQGLCIQAGWQSCGVDAVGSPGATHYISSNFNGAWCGVYCDFEFISVAMLAAFECATSGRIQVQGSIYGNLAGSPASGGGSNGIASRLGGRWWLPRNMLKASDGGTATLCFNIVPSVNFYELYLDGLASTIGPLNVANAGLVLPAAIDPRTWANYVAASPAGFNRNELNLLNGGGFLQGL